jgi:ADP-dependent NAD(P)H-hydrate dehydratase / NAD(P)H-hydrate epimerase
MNGGDAVLSVAEMYRADAAAAARGIPTRLLMEAAGAAVAGAVAGRWKTGRVSVLCGPGNNGGDGFAAARRLAAAGWTVRLGLLGDPAAPKGDAAWAAAAWPGPVEKAGPGLLAGAEVVVDALFGAGLARALSGEALELVAAIRASGLPVVAVDMPSGIDGDTGAVLGGAAPAEVTVTFFRPKPGHLLAPGRFLCGELVVADIGIPGAVLDGIRPRLRRNGPASWLDRLPRPGEEGHKYERGHALVLGGGRMTGAARLAARAARRAGAGLVTIACPAAAFAVYAAGDPGAIVEPFDRPEAFAGALADPRRNAVLLGPGAGATPETRAQVASALEAGRALVLDADALTVFADEPEALFAHLTERCVLTPHEGEFARLFGKPAGAGGGSKVDRARRAAERSGAVVLLKGPDTVVAHPDGRAAISGNGPPDLATAGSGDVLAGLVLGLLAQGMEAFDAACAAAWMHGEAARTFGPGLIAEDLPEALPTVLRRLRGGARD